MPLKGKSLSSTVLIESLSPLTIFPITHMFHTHTHTQLLRIHLLYSLQTLSLSLSVPTALSFYSQLTEVSQEMGVFLLVFSSKGTLFCAFLQACTRFIVIIDSLSARVKFMLPTSHTYTHTYTLVIISCLLSYMSQVILLVCFRSSSND